MQYDWSTFTKRISIKTDAKSIYDSWATQQGLEEWFLRLAAFVKPDGTPREAHTNVQAGDTYTWLWFGYGDETVEYGKVLQANGTDSFQFTFSGGCIVNVHVKEEHDETVCVLTQSNIPLTEEGKVNYHLGCMQGWTFYLANLKSYLEGGIDLRNKNDQLHDVINA